MKNQTRIACILWAVMTIVCGCKKNEIPNVSSVKGNGTLWAGDKKYDVLGYGYDITGRFANSESARLQVLDIDKFVREDPNSFGRNEHVEDYFVYAFGDDASGYSSDLAQKYTATLDLGLAKVVKLFKLELNASFHSKDTLYSKYAYASSSKIIKQKNFKLYSTNENLRANYLTDKFKSDVATLSPAALVQRYGTHVLTDITLGARFDMNYQTQTKSSHRTEAVKAGLTVTGMFKTFGMTANIDSKEEESKSNFDQKLYYSSVGGDGTKGLIGEIALDNSTLKLNIANWQSSCNADNAALIKIGKDGLVWLDEFISDPVKKDQVKAYIKQYLIDNQFILTNDKIYSESDMPNGLRKFIVSSFDYPNVPSTKIYPSNTVPALTVGQSISSPNGLFSLTLQADGNLVLFRNYNGRPALWNSVTQGNTVKSLYFQTDGNLVLFQGLGRDSAPVWASYRHDGTGQARLESNCFYALQDDGNFVYLFTYGSNPLKCYVLGATGTNTGVSNYPGKLWAN